MTARLQRLSALAAAAGLAMLTLPMASQALIITKGLDYFHTLPSSHFNFGAPIGDINLGYYPAAAFNTTNFGPVAAPGGNVDTVVERLEDTADLAVGGSDTIDVRVVALFLKSVNPVDIGGTLYDILVQSSVLQPVSSMTIHYNSAEDGTDVAEGTFDSVLNLILDVSIVEVGTSNVQLVDTLVKQATSFNASWSTTLTGKPEFPFEGPNFFPTRDPIFHELPGQGEHIIEPASIPEINAAAAPGALALLFGGLALLRERGRRRG